MHSDKGFEMYSLEIDRRPKVEDDAPVTPKREKTLKQNLIIEEPNNKQGKEKTNKIPKNQIINFEKVKIFSEANRLIETQYGTLKIPDSFKLSSLTNIYYMVNSSNINFISSVLRKDKISLLLFPPVETQ